MAATATSVMVAASLTVVDTAVSLLARATNSHSAKRTVGIKAMAKVDRAMDSARATECSDLETITVVKPNAASRDTSHSVRATDKRLEVTAKRLVVSVVRPAVTAKRPAAMDKSPVALVMRPAALPNRLLVVMVATVATVNRPKVTVAATVPSGLETS